MAAKCPHNCVRCRATELGLAGRALTQAEMILVHGGLAEKSNGHRVQWSVETADAAAALDVAQIERDDAYRTLCDVHASLQREGSRRGGRESERYQELAAAKHVALLELDEAEDRLCKLRSQYHELVHLDSRRRSEEEFRAGQEAQAKARKESAKDARKVGRKTLERLRGGQE